MPKIATKVSDADMRLLTSVMTQYHRHLASADVRIGALLIESDTDAPAVTFGGARAAAKIRRLNAANRLLTALDVVIEIDKDTWDELDEKQQRALLDHELTHLELDPDKKRYTDDRPVLKTRKDDWVLTGFYEVVQRHGAAALEAISIRKVVKGDRETQGTFPFMIQAPKPKLVKDQA